MWHIFVLVSTSTCLLIAMSSWFNTMFSFDKIGGCIPIWSAMSVKSGIQKTWNNLLIGGFRCVGHLLLWQWAHGEADEWFWNCTKVRVLLAKTVILLMEKSCTSWYRKYPIICRVLSMSGGAGFFPSTVLLVGICPSGKHPRIFASRQLSFPVCK